MNDRPEMFGDGSPFRRTSKPSALPAVDDVLARGYQRRHRRTAGLATGGVAAVAALAFGVQVLTGNSVSTIEQVEPARSPSVGCLSAAPTSPVTEDTMNRTARRAGQLATAAIIAVTATGCGDPEPTASASSSSTTSRPSAETPGTPSTPNPTTSAPVGTPRPTGSAGSTGPSAPASSSPAIVVGAPADETRFLGYCGTLLEANEEKRTLTYSLWVSNFEKKLPGTVYRTEMSSDFEFVIAGAGSSNTVVRGDAVWDDLPRLTGKAVRLSVTSSKVAAVQLPNPENQTLSLFHGCGLRK